MPTIDLSSRGITVLVTLPQFIQKHRVHCFLQQCRLRVTLAYVLAYTLSWISSLEAHPVAQGALDITIFSNHVNVRATVSNEEVLVAMTFSGRKTLPLIEMARLHGEYLLKHLYVTADGRLLDGRVVKVPAQASNRLSYEFEYRLNDSLPKHIGLQQDVLREFEFAPGNPWEASYFVRISHEGQPAVEDYLLTVRQPVDFECRWHQILSTRDTTQSDRGGIAIAFIRHGVMHILMGYDHLLFLSALLLATVRLSDLIKVISVFTVAHTLTLVLSVMDLFRLTGRIVEPMIAASIVIVAMQNVFWPTQSRGYSRLLITFLFGLFHGLGFAGGLLDSMSTMRGGAAVMAMIAFSIGIEIGHQFVVLPAFGSLRLFHRTTGSTLSQVGSVQKYGSGGIALAGVGYLVAALM